MGWVGSSRPALTEAEATGYETANLDTLPSMTGAIAQVLPFDLAVARTIFRRYMDALELVRVATKTAVDRDQSCRPTRRARGRGDSRVTSAQPVGRPT